MVLPFTLGRRSGAGCRGRRWRARPCRRGGGRGAGKTEGHARGRAGVDHVARFQDHVPAQVPDDVADREDHVAGVTVLPLRTVDAQVQAEVLRVAGLVGGDQPRAERVEGLAGFAQVPLRRVLQLEFPLRYVVADRVPGDHGPRGIRSVQVARPAADDDREFDLPVGLHRSTGDQHLVVRADDRARVLHEHHRTRGNRRAGLGGVIAVVQADADDLAGAGDGRPDAQAVPVQFGQLPRRDRRAGPVDPSGGEEGTVDVPGHGGQVQQPAVVDAHRGPLFTWGSDS